MKRRTFTMRQRRSMQGRLFVLPFYFGFLAFFLMPLVQSIYFAFCTVTPEVGRFDTAFVGIRNFHTIFRENPSYTRKLVGSLLEMLYTVPLILVAAFFFALLLNQKFRGRLLARAIFFLPVIVASGAVMQIINGDAFAGNVMSGEVGSQIGTSFTSGALENFFAELGMGAELVGYFTSIAQNIYDLLWQTGIQMLIFLSALQTISPSLYEASAMEGATAWENFWMITFPMILPMLFVNVVYSIVDNFTASSNEVMMLVTEQSRSLNLGIATAMGWVYFLLVAAVLGLVTAFFTRHATV